MNIKATKERAKENLAALLIGGVIVGSIYGVYLLMTMVAPPLVVLGVIGSWGLGKFLLNG